MSGRSADRAGVVKTILLFLLAMFLVRSGIAQTSDAIGRVVPPAVRKVQLPFASLKPAATFKIGENADWVQITDDAVWVASSKPASVHRIDPRTNQEVAMVAMPGDPCAGLAFGFGSLWVPLCGQPNSLVRVDSKRNKISAILPLGPAGAEGGIAVSHDSVWIVTDDAGTLVRINPATNQVRQKVSIAPGSYNPCFSDGLVWITGWASNLLTAVDAGTGKVVATIPVGRQPRFLTASPGSVWTLNQGDGTATRVDGPAMKVSATIEAGIPGHGGDIAWGKNTVWITMLGVPLTAIDDRTNQVIHQWVGPGGDSLRYGHDSVWLTDLRRGTLLRISNSDALKSKVSP